MDGPEAEREPEKVSNGAGFAIALSLGLLALMALGTADSVASVDNTQASFMASTVTTGVTGKVYAPRNAMGKTAPVAFGKPGSPSASHALKYNVRTNNHKQELSGPETSEPLSQGAAQKIWDAEVINAEDPAQQDASVAPGSNMWAAFQAAAVAVLAALGVKRFREQEQQHAKLAMATVGGAASLPQIPEIPEKSGSKFPVDIALMCYFLFWYLGNYYYNVTNKLALVSSGGAAGYPMTIAALQLGVGCIYAAFLWVAPDARLKPKITMDDVKKMIPVAICTAGAHASSVFALGAGAVSFAQIVKAAEPAFAAVLGTFFYGKSVSTAKWLCLIPVIGGVVLASLSSGGGFAWAALIGAAIANLFAAVKANENKKVMETDGLKERLGSVGNQFAVTMFLSFIFSLPLVLIREGSKLPGFWEVLKTNPTVQFNLIASGLWFYVYNELATLTIKKTSAVTASVANTAKRVIVIVGVALVLGESLEPLKLIGCAIGIGGVFLYSIIDNIVKPKDGDGVELKLPGGGTGGPPAATNLTKDW